MREEISFQKAISFVKSFETILPGEKLLLLRIIELLGMNYGGSAQSSGTDLCVGTGLTVRTTQRYIRSLKDQNIIQVVNCHSDSGMIVANKYRLNGWLEYNRV